MEQSTNTIHMIITGGTIDSYYEGSKDTVVPSAETIMPQYIQGLRLYNEVEYTTVCMKDSRDVSQADREQILKVIQESPHHLFLITHGTYTMPDTAVYLKRELGETDKTIILFGAMIPLQGFTMSDGGFNLGFAIANLFTSKPGVYVGMHGKLFLPENVKKNISEGRFESIFT